MNIVADENIDAKLIEELRIKGFKVYSIRENDSGIFDKDVLELSVNKNSLLITEDSDFGKLIHELNHSHTGVLFIRLNTLPRIERIKIIVDQIVLNYNQFKNNYYVLTPFGLRPQMQK